MEPEVRAELKRLLGEGGEGGEGGGRGFRDDTEVIARYGADETEALRFPPDCVVLPRSTEEVSRLLAFCDARHLPVTPRGAGTGLSGGALPVHGGVVLSLERMNRIVEIDRENLFAVVEPGVVTQTLQHE